MSEGEKLAARDAYLALEAEALQVAAPGDVDLVRWIKPEEFPETMVECQQEAGFDVTVTSDGLGVSSVNVPGSQTPALELASYECMAKYTVDPRYSLPLNAEQRSLKYEYLVSVYVPCVERLGYELSEPPSREVFIASEGLAAWIPERELMDLTSDEAVSLAQECPASPPSEILFGS